MYWDAVVIAEDGVEFKVNKHLLSEGSEYFRTFFVSDIVEIKDSATLGFESSILQSILQFLHTGEVYLNHENIAKMIIAADFLLIDKLLTHCRHFVLRNISMDCCMPLLAVSYIVERLGLTEYCFRFVQMNFGDLVRNNSDIQVLSFRAFKDLLNDDSLIVPDEYTVWETIVNWVNGNITDRLKSVPELVSCLKWNGMDNRVASSMASHPIFLNNEFLRSESLGQLFKIFKQEDLESGQLRLTTCRFPRKMYIVACTNRLPLRGEKLEIFLTYDSNLDLFRKIGETEANKRLLFTSGQFAFASTMYTSSRCDIKTFDLLNKRWHIKSYNRTTRGGHFVVRNKHFIVAVGGFVFMSNLKWTDVEYYDPITDAWSYSTPIPSNIQICGASVVSDKLYVIGFVENCEELEAYVYDRVCDLWSEIGKPRHYRTDFALADFHERLYILGGQTKEPIVTAVVEVYLPEEDEWKILPDLPFLYDVPRAVTVKDQLIVYDDFWPPTHFPCTWNEKNQFWEVVGVASPFIDIHRYQICTIDDPRVLQRLWEDNRHPETHWSKSPFSGY